MKRKKKESMAAILIGLGLGSFMCANTSIIFAIIGVCIFATGCILAPKN